MIIKKNLINIIYSIKYESSYNKIINYFLEPIVEIQHNNHTGRWISVFKAKWNPNRDDIFFVGSMGTPKQVCNKEYYKVTFNELY